MNIGVGLLLYGLAVLFAGPPLLRALTSNGHAPRLASLAEGEVYDQTKLGFKLR